MTALILIKFSLYGRPSGIPDSTVVVDVEITSAHIKGYVVIAVSRDPAEPCILIERITTCSVGDQREKSLITKIVDPGIRSPG